MKIDIKKLEKSEVEISGVLEWVEFEKYEEKALSKISERVELPGFRKGKVPADMVKGAVSEMELLEEMAQDALSENYIKILEENKIDAIGQPQIQITKIGKGSDLEFKIVTAIMPEIKLPDYKQIASSVNKKDEGKDIEVKEEEIEKVIKDLRQMRAEQSRPAHEHKEDESEEEHAKAHEPIPENEWPELNDEFAKSFGNFANVEELKEKIKNNIKIEKEVEQKDKIRLEIIEEIIKQSEGEIPEVLIQGETDKILYRLQADIANAGFKFEDYLKQINKTEEELRKEWRDEAEKRAKIQMIILKIEEKENLKPTEEEIEKDTNKIIEMYKEADPARARAYVEQMLGNEKVFKFLEEQN